MKRKHNFTITHKAEEEVTEAFLYYESRQENLGIRFLNNLEKCYESIDVNPYTYSIKFEDYRHAVVKIFPYVVIYKIYDSEILIITVFNTHQNPTKKFK